MPNRKPPLAITQPSIEEGVTAAIAMCRARGLQMTPLRQAVVRALWSAEQPLGAYELRDQLSVALRRKIPVASIYRTLARLGDLGVVSRIESRNAYVACTHPERDHTCVLFVCDMCGSSSEVENKELERLLAADAKGLGFSVDHRVVELSGRCADCQGPAI